MKVNYIGLAAAIFGWIAWGPAARADWASCRSHPTRTCLLDEALLDDQGQQLAGKERLDVLVFTSYRNHPEYLTTADIEEAKRQLKSPASQPALRWQYFLPAAAGLIATDRVQEALDLIPDLGDGWRNPALAEVIRALIKADRLDDIPVFGRPMLADPRFVFNTAVKILAEQGKIEQALAFTVLDPAVGAPDADMLEALGVAYARRGDRKMAARFYDRAQSFVEQRASSVVQDHSAMELRFDRIVLQAMRGDIDGAKASLKELPAVSDKPTNWVEINRNAGYQKLIALLLQLDNPGVAADIAWSTPERLRPYNILLVALWDVEHGRLDETREIMSSLGDATDPKIREGLQRGLAIATARAGDVAAAIAMAEQISDPVRHRAIIFDLAQSLPP